MNTIARTLPIVLFLSACAGEPAKVAAPAAPAAPVAASANAMQGPARITGYLPREVVPDSTVLSPPPPAANSPAMALDEALSRKYLAMQGSERWKWAATDAVLDFPAAADTFTCAVQAPITEAATPTVYKLLRRTLTDASRGTAGAKDFYKRTRPFMVNNQPICSPNAESILRTNWSYPSGHASIGWTWALVLAEVSPDQASAILARGRAFAESRLVCNVHWYSDVIEGMTMGSGVVARLHADPAFTQDVAQARQELAAVRASGAKPTRDCAAEAAALAPGFHAKPAE